MSNFTFSPLSIGTMRLDTEASTEELQAFVEGNIAMGLHDFDHADIYGEYGMEAHFGKLLKIAPHLRPKMQLITKCGIQALVASRPDNRVKHYNTTYDYIKWSAERSLRDLNTDYLDMLLIHRPDYLMEPQEIARAFTDLQKEGKVLHFGVSNFTIQQFDILHQLFPLVTNQIEMSLLHLNALEDDTLLYLQNKGVRPMVWSPFGGGSVFKVANDMRINRILEATHPLCQKYELALDQLLIAWLIRHPSKVVPVLGTSKLERIRAALEAVDVKLDVQDWYILLEASRGHRVA